MFQFSRLHLPVASCNSNLKWHIVLEKHVELRTSAVLIRTVVAAPRMLTVLTQWSVSHDVRFQGSAYKQASCSAEIAEWQQEWFNIRYVNLM
jgi:hypothetical protein